MLLSVQRHFLPISFSSDNKRYLVKFLAVTDFIASAQLSCSWSVHPRVSGRAQAAGHLGSNPSAEVFFTGLSE